MAAGRTVPRASARVLVIADDGRVLLLRYRGPDEAPQETVWLVPGGRAEGDETPAAAAARELWEEVGLVVDKGTAR